MYFETHPLPYQFGQLNGAPPYNLYNHYIVSSLFQVLTRLHNEKQILEKGLANCVTYLQVLCKNQAQNARVLNMEPPAPRKKRKRAQQIKRHLENEIKNRHRDEKALLNNIQACNINILVAEVRACYTINISLDTLDYGPTPALYIPIQCTYSGSETTDLSWNGWTDESVVSPFQKRSSSALFADEVAPDGCAEDRRDSVMAKEVKRPTPLSQDAEELSNSLLVLPSTAQSQYPHLSILSPAAAIFEPTPTFTSQCEDRCRPKLDIPSMSNSMATKCMGFTDADVGLIFQLLPIDARPDLQHLPSQTWCNTTPQRSLQKDMGIQMNRQRVNSL
jgi:hypothetical protein